jgi:hypothetical protein
MIEASLNGRLGNQLFQYAAARSLALDRGTQVVLDVSRYTRLRDPLATQAVRALRFFNLDAAYSRAGEDLRHALQSLHLRERRAEYRERGWSYDPELHAQGSATRLLGYFQSPRYWRGHEASIRADLQPARLPRGDAFERVRSAMEASVSVALHVRRGDYLTTERELHQVCGDEYYDRALAFVHERVRGAKLYVFSDDPAWCRSRFATRDPSATIVDLAAARAQPGLDLYLMSRCKHHIISNSTYSWWGAWLAAAPGQIVCTPSRWFNDEAMSAAAMRDTVPEAWQRIDCERQAQPA